MDELADLQEYILKFNTTVCRNVKLVSHVELGQEYLYHISNNGSIKKFIPQISRRTAKVEDRSVPRVSTAKTIVGCILGYQGDIAEFENGPDKVWKGGWYIYGFSKPYSLRPNAKLLYDVETSDEHWLVPYNQSKWEYPATVVGKYFYVSNKLSWIKGKSIDTTHVVVEVLPGRVVVFGPKTELTEGYWSLEFLRSKEVGAEVLRCSSISKADYVSLKGLHADLLSYPV